MRECRISIQHRRGLRRACWFELGASGGVEDFRRFVEIVLAESDSAILLWIREYRNILAMPRQPGFRSMSANSQNMPFAILTVGVGGELFTFSPELVELSNEAYNDFVIGRLPDATLETVLSRPTFRSY